MVVVQRGAADGDGAGLLGDGPGAVRGGIGDVADAELMAVDSGRRRQVRDMRRPSAVHTGQVPEVQIARVGFLSATNANCSGRGSATGPH